MSNERLSASLVWLALLVLAMCLHTPRQSMSVQKRVALALVWLALLVLAGWWISQRLELSGDLRKFMPPPAETGVRSARCPGAAEETSAPCLCVCTPHRQSHERTQTRRARAGLALAAVVAGWWISQRLQLSGDLRKFMPPRRRNRRGAVPDAAGAAEETSAPMLMCLHTAQAVHERTQTRRARAGLAPLLVLAGWWISQRLELSGDLRKFMPAPQTPAQKLLIDELGEGPGSRLLLISLSGSDAGMLASQSQALATHLVQQTAGSGGIFNLVANGSDAGLEAIPDQLRPYRYLLSPTLDTQGFDAAYLRDELSTRVQDLGSPAATLIEPLLPSDPTLETLRLAEAWQPANAPQRLHGVWFDRPGREALLVAQTEAAGRSEWAIGCS